MKKLIIFDMDGTIYLGKNLIDGALETFDYLNKENIKYIFFTNNSSHSLESYYKKVSNFGIKCTLEDNFYSTTEILLSYLEKNNIHDIYVIANKFLKDKLESKYNIIKDFDENIKLDAVVAGFSTELVYKELRDASLYLETRDVPFIATNRDFRCPIEDGLYIPDCGGMCEWLRLTTGKKAHDLGKPDPEIINYFMDKYNLEKKDILMVGDRIYTDILCGVNAKVDTVMVLSGETKLEELKDYDYSPTYILDSIKDLPALLSKI